MTNSTTKKILLPIFAIAGLLLMVAWLAGSFDTKIAPDSVQKRMTVKIDEADKYRVTYQEQMVFEPVAGGIEAKQATVISSRLLARIDKINVRAGDIVKRGDSLIELEKSDLDAQVLQAVESVNGAKARHKESSNNLQRAISLFAKSLISAHERDNANANFDSAAAQLTQAKQRLMQARVILGYASITAPIDGKVVDRFAQPGDTAQPGAKLLSIYNPNSLRIEANVREKLALSLTHGLQLKVEVPSLGKTLGATVDEIVPAANVASRSFLIKASVEINKNLMPGMYARILLPSQNRRVLSVPNDKISHVGQLSFVNLLVEGQVQRRLIRLGKKQSDGSTWVLSGLSNGDMVVDTL